MGLESSFGGDQMGLRRELAVALILAGVFLAGVIVVVALVMALRPSTAPQAVVPALDYSIQTAREAYVPAVELIRQHDPAAELASGAGAWTPVIDTVYLVAGRTGWTFHFYLPNRREMATVVVDRGGLAHLVDSRPWQTPPDLLDDQAWQVDSPQALDLFYRQCKPVLDTQPGSKVQARLSTAASNRTLVWQVKLLAPDSELPICEVSIDATTGIVR
ncbi:MAG: hypothetical protein QXP01_07505 [Candidatus Hadarchaeum sp.]